MLLNMRGLNLILSLGCLQRINLFSSTNFVYSWRTVTIYYRKVLLQKTTSQKSCLNNNRDRNELSRDKLPSCKVLSYMKFVLCFIHLKYKGIIVHLPRAQMVVLLLRYCFFANVKTETQSMQEKQPRFEDEENGKQSTESCPCFHFKLSHGISL